MERDIDLLVSFDTTGSMYPCLAQVRREVSSFLKTMFTEFKNLQIGVIVYGDYCDKDNPYTILAMDFTRDIDKLVDFVNETERTFGGDADECYELVLNTANEVFKWRDKADKIMIMIGDASPHSPSYHLNSKGLDWREEADNLATKGIKVFSVHALAGFRSTSRGFYKTVAEKTNGVYLTLDMFNEIVDLIKATVYQQGGEEKLSEFITIIRDSGKLTHSMDRNIRRLKGEKVEDDYSTYTSAARYSYRSMEEVKLKSMDKLVPVIPGRFQVMTVDENTPIKEFVQSNGIEFKKGRGFYELSKAETVQQYKEVIIQDRETGEMFTGAQVREELGLQPQSEKGGVNERLHKSATEKFRVFVQSTSVNRKLIGGTTFLYEISDLEDTGTLIETSEEPKPRKKKTVTVIKKPRKKVEETKSKKAESPKKDGIVSKEEAETLEDMAKIIDVSIDEEKKAVTLDDKVSATKNGASKKNKKTPQDKVAEQIIKVTDGLERYAKSTNKKNTAYLSNNLKKLIEESEKLLEMLK